MELISIVISLIVLGSNVSGAVLMARYGVPSVVPLIGRKGADASGLGILGLVVFISSIAVRVIVVLTETLW